MTMSTIDVPVADGITQCLRREGITTIFGIPGGYFTTLLDAFRRSKLRSVEGRHEGAAACMAAGYAQASGQVGVVYAQAGPGTTNTVTGMAAAFMDSIPMLLIAAQIHRDDFGRDGHQEATGYTKSFDQVDIFRTMSHYSVRSPTALSSIRLLRSCLRASICARGPSVYEISTDVLPEVIPFEDMEPDRYRLIHPTPVDHHAVEQVCELLRNAKSPVLLVGDRLMHVGAAAEVAAFCEEQQVACATVNYAKGTIPEDHELFVGILNQTGHGSAASFLRNADLVISIGARLNHVTTLHFAPDLFSNLVQIDNDEQEIGRSFPIRLGVLGDPLATLKALRSTASRPTVSRDILKKINKAKAEYTPYDDPESREDTPQLKPPRVMRILREALPREALVVGDTGSTQVTTSRHLPVYSQDGYFSLYALAPMGSGLPMSLGVQLARPEAVVLSVIGDGGFLTHAGELSVAVQHKLPVIHVVINNGTYKSIGDRMEKWFGATYAVDIHNPDFAKLGESFGCAGYTVRTGPELRDAAQKAIKERRPAVIEVVVDRGYKNKFAPEAEGFQKKIFSSRPTDWPFPKP